MCSQDQSHWKEKKKQVAKTLAVGMKRRHRFVNRKAGKGISARVTIVRGGGGWKVGGMESAVDGKWGKASYWDPGMSFFHGFFWCI